MQGWGAVPRNEMSPLHQQLFVSVRIQQETETTKYFENGTFNIKNYSRITRIGDDPSRGKENSKEYDDGPTVEHRELYLVPCNNL